ncbi:hypothetical protein BGY98DRAFT_948476 [Russula aff. rugulosa BPL654]|nr:hypothetical protein BGY98DRAFT_948476 [Russula aff. rugulosa BPL654]
MKFSLTLPIILSALYVSFSQAQNNSFPPCAASCAKAEATQTGCNITNPTSTSCFCTDEQFIKFAVACVLLNCTDSDGEAAKNYWDSVCE